MLTPMDKRVVILMADDSASDRKLVQAAMSVGQMHNGFRFVEDGEELMDYLRRRGKYTDPSDSPLPELILLDLNMPRKDGREALQEIRADSQFRHLPVVVLTTSDDDDDIYRSYNLGANSYIRKPVTFEGLIELMQKLGDYWFGIVQLPTLRR